MNYRFIPEVEPINLDGYMDRVFKPSLAPPYYVANERDEHYRMNVQCLFQNHHPYAVKMCLDWCKANEEIIRNAVIESMETPHYEFINFIQNCFFRHIAGNGHYDLKKWALDLLETIPNIEHRRTDCMYYTMKNLVNKNINKEVTIAEEIVHFVFITKKRDECDHAGFKAMVFSPVYSMKMIFEECPELI